MKKQKFSVGDDEYFKNYILGSELPREYNFNKFNSNALQYKVYCENRSQMNRLLEGSYGTVVILDKYNNKIGFKGVKFPCFVWLNKGSCPVVTMDDKKSKYNILYKGISSIPHNFVTYNVYCAGIKADKEAQKPELVDITPIVGTIRTKQPSTKHIDVLNW